MNSGYPGIPLFQFYYYSKCIDLGFKRPLFIEKKVLNIWLTKCTTHEIFSQFFGVGEKSNVTYVTQPLPPLPPHLHPYPIHTKSLHTPPQSILELLSSQFFSIQSETIT